MVIRDEDEILFFLKFAANATATEQDNSCIWTNCKDLVKAFVGVFEQLWHNSSDIKNKIKDIEAGKMTSKLVPIEDFEMAKKKYMEIVSSAKEAIVIITSS